MNDYQAMQSALERQDATYKALRQTTEDLQGMLETEDGKAAVLAYERYLVASSNHRAAVKRLQDLENKAC